jgi:hypothetical protein
MSNIYQKKMKIPEYCWFDWLASPEHMSGSHTIAFVPLSLLYQTLMKPPQCSALCPSLYPLDY